MHDTEQDEQLVALSVSLVYTQYTKDLGALSVTTCMTPNKMRSWLLCFISIYAAYQRLGCTQCHYMHDTEQDEQLVALSVSLVYTQYTKDLVALSVTTCMTLYKMSS